MNIETTAQQTSYRLPDGVVLSGRLPPEFLEILTPAALQFVATIQREFGERRRELLKLRADRQHEINYGKMPDFLPATRQIREAYWRVAPVPTDLLDRRVEITGPTDRKMMINALNSGANVFMADLEDSNVPTWGNMLQGQVNLRDAVSRTIRYEGPEGKLYTLGEQLATLMMRPRGLHMDELHMLVDGAPVAASFFDFGLFLFHNAQILLERGTGPYVYIPKIESHFEARLWNDLFQMTQDELGIPHGSIRCTVLIETVLAAFEMNEILYELREHCVGLNCGRWDYIFSFIKKFHLHPEFILPERSRLTMATRFLHAYSLLLIQTCHKRGAHALGGMAAHIPVKKDPAAHDDAMMKVRADKEREVEDGHDGTWVAHPALVPIAKQVFDTKMNGPNQLHRKREDEVIEAADLLQVPKASISEAGVRNNILVCLQYISSWFSGTGCVPIQNLMEDAATVEISRALLWQWVHHPFVRLVDGKRPTEDLFTLIVAEEYERALRNNPGISGSLGRLDAARKLLVELVTGRKFTDFFTTAASGQLETLAAR